MLDLHRLRVLFELQRLGTVTAVAEALQYTHSAISQQLAQWRSCRGCSCQISAASACWTYLEIAPARYTQQSAPAANPTPVWQHSAPL
nr:LysR family transcriptional regulator [Corynebacterium striatum]